MAKYVMEFERGGSFEVQFYGEAPKTTAAFQKALPIEAMCYQGRYAGEEFFFQAPAVEVEAENLVEPEFGDLSFNCDPGWKAVCVFYGPSHEGGPYNRFAKLVGDLDELNRIGVRIWKQGGEKVVFKEA